MLAMNPRIAFTLSTLNGVEFALAAGGKLVQFHLSPEALFVLRDRYAPGAGGGSLGLFKRFSDEIVEFADWMLRRPPARPQGKFQLDADDARLFLGEHREHTAV